jgi:subtilisin family serine protease
MDQLRRLLDYSPRAPRGDDVRVAVIDTGVDASHPALERAVDRNAAYSVIAEDDATRDYDGHGTHVAGIIAGRRTRGSRFEGLAPDARIVPIKVYRRWRDGVEAGQIADAVQHAVRNGVDLIVLAATYSPNDDEYAALLSPKPPWVWPAESKFVDAVGPAERAGILCVVPAGNDGPDAGTINEPAYVTGVLSVGAVRRDLQVAKFSSRGPCHMSTAVPANDVMSVADFQGNHVLDCGPKPDLVTLGVNICGPRSRDIEPGGLTPKPCSPPRRNSLYVLDRGTSEAAAIAAGMAACALSVLKRDSRLKRTRRGLVLRQLLLSAAVARPGRRSDYGYGFLSWPGVEESLERFAQDRQFARSVAKRAD